MQAYQERQYYTKFDKSFRITILLEKLPFLNKILALFMSILFRLIRITCKKNRKTGIITIINLHRLGDTVFSVPAIREVYRHYSAQNINIYCYSETIPILQEVFPWSNLIPVRKEDFFLQRRIAKNKLRKKIRSEKAEIIIDLTGTPASASMIFTSSARMITGTNYEHLKGVYDKYLPIRLKPDFMDIYLDIVNLLVPIKPNRDQIKTFEHINSGSGLIVIHPFAIRKAKEWNLNRFIKLAINLSKNYNVKIIAPPGFIDSDVRDVIADMNISFKETSDINDLITEMKKCSLFISNDSGPIFIAGMLGKATFTIYGPTNPKYSHLNGMYHRYIIKKLKCSADNFKFCFTLAGVHCPSNECLQLIKLEDVLNEVFDFLEYLKIAKRTKEEK